MKEKQRAVLWQGRFAESPDEKALKFSTSIHVDERLVFDDIRGSIAHVHMLGHQGLILPNEAEEIVHELEQIAAGLLDGRLVIDDQAEDIHSFIEQRLTERLGDTGKKVHTGRSRNDQIALDERLYLRRALPDLQVLLLRLIDGLTKIALEHTDSLMIGYTHMQRAQPVSLAHHLCAWAWPLVRDYERLSDALKRIDLCPLGAGALAASGLPLNREMVAAELGFSGITENSLDAVSDRDYCIEITAALSLIMMHLSRFCEEVILWSTEEFKFIELSESWSTGSSIMPQKKNPDFAELIRGKTGRVYGNLIALLTMMKGLPLAYNRDMQEDKESLFAAYDTVFFCLEIFTSMISAASWNVKNMAASCSGGYANATDLADYLVKKGLPFRTAHSIAAQAVRKCIDRNIELEELPLADYAALSDLIKSDIYNLLSPQHCREAKNIAGGPAKKRVEEQIQKLQRFYREKTR